MLLFSFHLRQSVNARFSLMFKLVFIRATYKSSHQRRTNGHRDRGIER